MAAATVTCPMLRRIRSSSVRMRATTGSAEIDIATATKAANVNRDAASPKNGVSGITRPSPKPRPIGTTRLPIETAAAFLPSRRSSARSVSKPVSTSSSATPTHAIARIGALPSTLPGNSHSAWSGRNRPKRDGPISRPAPSSPTTAGWPARLKR